MNTKLVVVLTAILGFAATTVVLAQDAAQAPADSTEMAAPAVNADAPVVTEEAPAVNADAPAAAPSNTY